MKKISTYLVVGVASVVIQWGLLALFVESSLLKPVLASFVSYLVSSIFNYFANYYLTFSSQKNHIQSMTRYFAVVAISLGLNTFLFYWLMQLFTFYGVEQFYLVAQSMVTVLMVMINFVVIRKWVY
jgi:putative flippase GtrA